MDTWLDQTFYLLREKTELASLEEKQKAFVELCREAGCSSIAFNQGTWIVGSQIAGEYATFKNIAFGDGAKEILKCYVKEEKLFLCEIEKLINNIS